MKKIAIIFIMSLMLLAFVLAESVNVSRDLSDFKNDSEFNVTLVVSVDSVTAMGITEYAPADAEILSTSAKDFRITGNKIEILLFDSSQNVSSGNITYTVRLNSDENDFHGTWIIVDPDLNGSIVSLNESSESSEVTESPTTPTSPSSGSSSGSSGHHSSGGGGVNTLTQNPTTTPTETENALVDLSFTNEESSETATPTNSEKTSSNQTFWKISFSALALIIFASGFFAIKKLVR